MTTSALTARRRISLRRALFAAAALALLLLLLALVLLAVLRHRMHATVAPLDGTLHLPGLLAPVTVQRDAEGVPHIQAANLHDLLAAQGWVTASDRLWQMDMARRLPAGEAAEVLGSGLVPHDRMERLLGLRDVADRMVRTMPPDQLAQLQAYASGVNAYIQSGRLPAEFLLLAYRPRVWTPKDSVLIAISMAQMLDERWPGKLKREQVMARLRTHGDAALAADLYPVGSWRDHPPVPSAPGISDPQIIPQIPLDPSQLGLRAPLPTPLLPVSGLLAMATLADEPGCAGCRRGSNEWAVSGKRTASGKPLLANDMHIEHQIPNIWYETGLRAPGFHATGVTVPGLPFITAGHNDHIAWGFTALGGDTQDLYVEDVNAKNQYRTVNADGSVQWAPLAQERETIRVRGAPDIRLDIQRTAHGPILTSIIPGEHRSVSLRWSIYSPQAAGLPLYALDTATNWTSFRAALATWWAPTLNVVYADDAGHIGYQAVGLIPIRSGGLQAMPIVVGRMQPTQPAPTSPTPPAAAESPEATPTPGASAPPALPAAPSLPVGEWSGFIPFNALPSVLDPESGMVATANARVSPDDYPYQLTLDWAAPYRNERIWKWLGDKRGLTRKDMITLQTDVYSESDQEIAQRLAYAIDRTPNAPARTRTAADILRTWNGVLSIDSPGAMIVTAAEDAFWPAVLEPKLGDASKLYAWGERAYAREQMIATQPAAWLPPQYRSWNDFLAALVEGVLKGGPKDLHSWRYGATHIIEVEHPLWSHLPWMHAGVGPLPQSGDPSTVKQVTGDLGPSQRFTADMNDLDASTENILTGESGDPMSPYFRNQWPFWYGGTTFALPYTSSAVRTATRHTLLLVP